MIQRPFDDIGKADIDGLVANPVQYDAGPSSTPVPYKQAPVAHMRGSTVRAAMRRVVKLGHVHCLLWCVLAAAAFAGPSPDSAIVGEWSWREGILTVAQGGKFMHANGDGGTWSTLPDPRTYQLAWGNGYVDRVVVSEDGRTVAGTSNDGRSFTAQRRGPTQSTAPPSVQVPAEPQPTAPPSVQAPAKPQQPPLATAQSAPQAVVIVEGDAGVGSGFVTVLAGELVAVTNAHVIVGNRQVRLRGINGELVPFKQIRLGVRKDLAVLPLYGWAGPVLAVQEDVERTVAIGDEIVAYGNSGGQDVVTEAVGNINGIGPEKVEVTAGVVEGNSGGPIVLAASGRVVAVATYACMSEPTWVTTGTRFAEVRRFGHRLDNLAVTDLQELNEVAYYSDLERYRTLHYRDRQAIALLVDFAGLRRVRAGSVEDGLLRHLAIRLNRAMADAEESLTVSSAKRLAECFGQLREYLAAPLSGNPPPLAHSFIQQMYTEEAELNRIVQNAVKTASDGLRELTHPE